MGRRVAVHGMFGVGQQRFTTPRRRNHGGTALPRSESSCPLAISLDLADATKIPRLLRGLARAHREHDDEFVARRSARTFEPAIRPAAPPPPHARLGRRRGG